MNAQGVEIDFRERFALASDRRAVLDQLIPGTDEHFFYSCLLAQHEQRLEEVDRLLPDWIARHGRTNRVRTIENRQALLRADVDPAGAIARITEHIGPSLGDQKRSQGTDPALPTRLDPALLARERLVRHAFDAHRETVDGFRDAALDRVAAGPLDDRQLVSLLRRLRVPSAPNLAELVLRELSLRNSAGFGAIPIHAALTLEQLERCVAGMPALLNSEQFVGVWLARLQPTAEENIELDPAARDAWLARLAAFTSRLAPVHNTLIAQVLHWQLAADLKRGAVDRERLMRYLRLPRQRDYVNPRWLEQRGRAPMVAEGESRVAGLAPIQSSEGLVRACLEQVFLDAADFSAFRELLEPSWLARVFAETKILYGIGDSQRWFAMIDSPSYYEALRNRVEIEFDVTTPDRFAVEEPVALEIEVKNVQKLLVKVFEVDTLNYLLAHDRAVDASIDLDGLIANEQTTIDFAGDPMRRRKHRLEFPQMNRAGVWVVELIGNGMASRALIRKGRLSHVERHGAAGHDFRVFDDRGNLLTDATIRFAGREFRAGESGVITIPYSTEPGERTVILQHGEFAELATFPHEAERYELDLGVALDREALLPGERAPLAVRATLSIAGERIPIGLLEEPVLSITGQLLDGRNSQQDLSLAALRDDVEFRHELAVPEDLVALRLQLRGRMRSLTGGTKLDVVSDRVEFSLNGIARTAQTHCPLLSRGAEGYVIDLLGRNGEAKANRAVTVRLSHRDFTDTITVSMRSDAAGRVTLGQLPEIERVECEITGAEGASWSLSGDSVTTAARIAVRVGEPIHVARTLGVDAAAHLFEVRRDGRTTFVASLNDRIERSDSEFLIPGLAAGSYRLFHGRDRVTEIEVAAGAAAGPFVVGSRRILTIDNGARVHVRGMRESGDSLEIELGHASPNTRVHVLTSRFDPAFDVFAHFASGNRGLAAEQPRSETASTFHEGREIGDELRYILERRLARKFPGNMLERPTLLLNPWALEETATALGGEGRGGGRFGGPSSPAPGAARAGAVGERGRSNNAGEFADLAFLANPSRLIENLRPDAEGKLRVPLADLGDAQSVRVLVVDLRATAVATHLRPLSALSRKPRDLAAALDSEQNFAQRRSIEFVDVGKTAVIDDIRTAEIEVFDTLGKVFGLLRTASGNAELDVFSPLLRWPTLTQVEKRAFYSAHACHELHFFLYRKDREFFESVVRPYLANKLAPTFLDDWLLERELGRYLDDYEFQRLNTLERILLAARLPQSRAGILRRVADEGELTQLTPAETDAAIDRGLAALFFAQAETGVQEKLKDARKAELRRMRANADAESEDKNAPGREQAAKRGVAPEPSDSDEFYLGAGAARAAREEVAELYRAPDATRRYAESHYWHLPLAETTAELVRPNRFWLDFAAAESDRAFFSSNFPLATGTLAEMLLAIAVLDLPFEAAEHESVVEGSSMRIVAKSPLLLLRREIRPSDPAGTALGGVLVSENFYRLDRRYRYEGNEQLDAWVEDEFLVDIAYGAQVVVTNPTSVPRRMQLLLQIPAGAVAVMAHPATRGASIQIAPYSTAAFDYAFYFPSTGERRHYPAHVSADGRHVAAAAGSPALRVVAEATRIDTSSWEHVSQEGTGQDVLRFLSNENLLRVDLAEIAWRMRDREFFDATIRTLRNRQLYSDRLWAYSLLHRDIAAIGEYLRHQDGFLATCGRALQSPWIAIDAVGRRNYEHIEFAPLFNARAHRFGATRRILNASQAGQYLDLLDVLVWRPKLDDLDRLAVTYHMLLQDRTEEALDHFSRIDGERLESKIQLDYLRAYLEFFGDEPARARAIADRYADHPVDRWRNRFAEIAVYLDEAEGRRRDRTESEIREQRLAELAGRAPSLEAVVDGARLRLAHDNLAACRVRFYKMDVEFLFSTAPFAETESSAFALVKPNAALDLVLEQGAAETIVDLPAELLRSNLRIEVSGAGIVRRTAYFANSLDVRWVESYGQVQVFDRDGNRPAVGCYVKVYARTSAGRVRFHKDGYTDIRGRFDYASLSGAGAADVATFAVLVASETAGAMIREVDAPTR
jgi:hypothetical protein